MLMKHGQAKEKQHIQTAEINFLRYMSGYYLRDRMRNGYIRVELGTFSINDKIEQRKQHLIIIHYKSNYNIYTVYSTFIYFILY